MKFLYFVFDSAIHQEVCFDLVISFKFTLGHNTSIRSQKIMDSTNTYFVPLRYDLHSKFKIMPDWGKDVL